MERHKWFIRIGVCGVFATTLLLFVLSGQVKSQCTGFWWEDVNGGGRWVETCVVPPNPSYGWVSWTRSEEPTEVCYDYRYPYCNYADDQAAPPPDACGDERDTIIAEYAEHGVGFRPFCTSFRNDGGSTNFHWSELNGGFQNGNPHNPWGIITIGLLNGLESTRVNYNRGGIRLTSGYRCPHGNAAANGKPQSLHMHGKAADMYSSDHSWTETEFNLLKAAADATSPAPIESLFWGTYADRHFHAAWHSY